MIVWGAGETAGNGCSQCDSWDLNGTSTKHKLPPAPEYLGLILCLQTAARIADVRACVRARARVRSSYTHIRLPPPAEASRGHAPHQEDRPQPTARGGMEPTSPRLLLSSVARALCASPHPPAVPSLHVPATPTLCAPAHAFPCGTPPPGPPKTPNPPPQPPEPCTRPCPAHTSPAPGTSHVSLPGAGVSAALVLWGSWAGCGCPALRQQSDHLHWVVGPLHHGPNPAHPPPGGGSPAQLLEEA